MKSWTPVGILWHVLYIIYVSGLTITHDGQPGCKTDKELNTKFYRNLWDPTAYWLCSVKNTPAESKHCPGGTAFYDSLKACVPWDNWEWEEMEEPPSYPGKNPERDLLTTEASKILKTPPPPKRVLNARKPSKRMMSKNPRPQQRMPRMNGSKRVIKVVKNQNKIKRLIKVRKAPSGK